MRHFENKDVISHVAEAHAKGIIASAEMHGKEIPGSLSAGADAARETAIALLLFSLPFTHASLSVWQNLAFLGLFAFGWLIWKTGRSAWLGWSRLERLHRILEEERWEIEHSRSQERAELEALYTAKGLSGQLLKDVVDVLMADEDRLLKVMIEEELGLSLEVHEHPLKQGLGAGLGVLISAFFCLLGYGIWPPFGLYITAALVLGISAGWSACYEKNRIVPAIVWILGIGVLAVGSAFFLLDYLAIQGWLP